MLQSPKAAYTFSNQNNQAKDMNYINDNKVIDPEYI